MNILIVIFGLILSPIESTFIGYNRLNLIDEGKPLKIHCLSSIKSIPEHYNVIEFKWFNVTLLSTDPYDHRNEHILMDETNELFTIRSNGELYSRKARPEHNGYYSCRVHYFDRRNKENDRKLTEYRLHLIEVTKKPRIKDLEQSLVIQVFTDTDSLDSETIDLLLKDLVLNKGFETRIHSDDERVLCEFNSDINLMKCQLKLKSKSKKGCSKSQCSFQQNIFDRNVEKDLQKIQNLLKTEEELFRRKLNIQMIDFEVKKEGYHLSDCPEGYYLDSYRCRPCPPGQYRTKGDQSCRECADNTYNPFFGQSSCIDCPKSSRTAGPGFEGMGTGASHVHECKYFYDLGFYG